jgi:hypothetical protein
VTCGAECTAVIGDASDSNHDENPSDSRNVVLVLRLVLDRHTHLCRGELFDVQATRLGQFVSIAGLAEVIRVWLEQQREVAL